MKAGFALLLLGGLAAVAGASAPAEPPVRAPRARELPIAERIRAMARHHPIEEPPPPLRRPQRPRHQVGDHLEGSEAQVPDYELDRRDAFPRAGAYRPSDLFRVLPSTRRVRRVRAIGEVALAATEGGLLVARAGAAPRTLLPGVEVFDLAPGVEDPAATLVATARGLFRLRGDELEQLHPTPTTSVAVVPSRGLRLTGHPAGLVQWTASSGEERISRIETRSPIRHLAVHDRLLFAGNGEGLWSIDSAGEVFEEPVSPDPAAAPITWLIVHDGAVHAGTPAGLFRRDPAGWRRLGGPVHVLGGGLIDEALWVGTHDAGNFELTGNRLEPTLARLPATTAVAAGPGRRLFVGTHDQGLVSVTDGDATRVVDPSREPPGNHVTGLAWAERLGALFAGTYDYGVGRWAPAVPTWTHLGKEAGLPSLWTNEVASDGAAVAVRVSDGTVALSLDGARFQIQGPGTGWPKTWTSGVSNAEGALVATTHEGYYLRRAGGWDLHFPLPALAKRMVLAAAHGHGRTYLGTHRTGLWVGEAGRWRRYSLGTGLPDSWIPALTWHGGDLWAATFHGGLLRFPGGEVDPTTVQVFRAADSGLPGDQIHALLATGSHLWVGTHQGLGVLTAGRWQSFLLEDGLPSEDITALASDGRRLWIGTRRGLVEADLESLIEAAGSR